MSILDWQGKHLISMRGISVAQIKDVLEISEKFRRGRGLSNLNGKFMATLFFEPSTRTRFSFELAMKKLGGKVISMEDIQRSSSRAKGESLADTAKIIERYVDIIVIRHKAEGSARFVAENVSCPVINAGDGANQHPSQALLDIYSILLTQRKLRNLKIGFVGDLKYGRTVHSLIYALKHFDPHFYFISPPSLKVPQYIKDELSNSSFQELSRVEEIIPELDILYLTRIQKERFADPEEYEKVANFYVIGKKLLKNAKSNLRILHPLPRLQELPREIDETKYAYYFQQAENGIYVREAILYLILHGLKSKGGEIDE